MPNNFEKVGAGQPLSIPAAAWNSMLEVADEYTRRKLGIEGAGPGSPPLVPALRCSIQNDTGDDLEEFSIVRLTTPPILPDERTLNAQAQPIFSGDVPASSTDLIGILVEPIADGGIGCAAVMGLVVATVNVRNVGHRWANPSAGDTGKLVSGAMGIARIAYPTMFTVTGDTLCQVLLIQYVESSPRRLLKSCVIRDETGHLIGIREVWVLENSIDTECIDVGDCPACGGSGSGSGGFDLHAGVLIQSAAASEHRSVTIGGLTQFFDTFAIGGGAWSGGTIFHSLAPGSYSATLDTNVLDGSTTWVDTVSGGTGVGHTGTFVVQAATGSGPYPAGGGAGVWQVAPIGPPVPPPPPPPGTGGIQVAINFASPSPRNVTIHGLTQACNNSTSMFWALPPGSYVATITPVGAESVWNWDWIGGGPALGAGTSTTPITVVAGFTEVLIWTLVAPSPPVPPVPPVPPPPSGGA